MHKQKKILAVVSDLLFTVKINDAAKRAGMAVDYAKSGKEALEKAKDKPTLIIMDLNFSAAEPLKVISKLKGDSDLKSISVISFVSHVEGELKQKAHEAGANLVMARSAFSTNLPQILKRHSGVLH
jgi:PleD family two-component response regulator